MMRAGFYILLFVTVSEPQRQSNPIGFQVPPNVGEQNGQHSGQTQGPIIVRMETDLDRTVSEVMQNIFAGPGGLTQTPQQQQLQQQKPTVHMETDAERIQRQMQELFPVILTPTPQQQQSQKQQLTVANVHAGNRTNKDVEDCMWDINQLNAGRAKCHTGSFFPPAKIFGCMKKLRDANLRDCLMQGGMDMDEMRREACVKVKPNDTEGLWNDIMQPDRNCATEFSLSLAVKCAEGCTGMDTSTNDENERANALMKRCVPKSSGNMQAYLNQCNNGSAAYLSFLSLMVTIVIALCLSCGFQVEI